MSNDLDELPELDGLLDLLHDTIETNAIVADWDIHLLIFREIISTVLMTNQRGEPFQAPQGF